MNKPKRIKIPKEQIGHLTKTYAIQSQLLELGKIKHDMIESVWENLKADYPDYNFDCAEIDHKTHELVLPFEYGK